MQKMNWLESHIGSIDDALKVINQLGWEASVKQTDHIWFVLTGSEEKHIIFSADTRNAVDAFLYGMALALVGIPSPMFEKLVEGVAEWRDNL